MSTQPAVRDVEFNRHLEFAWRRPMLIQHSNTGSMFSLVAHKKLFATLAMFVLLLVSYQMVSLPEHVPTEEPLPIDDTTEHRRLLSTLHPLDGVPHSKTLGVASR